MHTNISNIPLTRSDGWFFNYPWGDDPSGKQRTLQEILESSDSPLSDTDREKVKDLLAQIDTILDK